LARFYEGEDAVDAEGDADAGDLLLAAEHADEFIVAAASGDGANTHGGIVGAVVVVGVGFWPFAGFGFWCGGVGGAGRGGGAFGHDFVDDAGVVVEAASEGHVEGDFGEDGEGLEIVEEKGHVVETFLGGLIGAESGIGLQFGEKFTAAFVLDVFADLVCHGGIKPFVFGHFATDFRPW